MVGDNVADGKIILQTKVDTSGIKKGEADIEKAGSKMGAVLDKALKSGNAEIKKSALNYQKATAEVEKQTQKVAELKQQIATIKSGGEVKNATITSLSKQLEKVDGDIEKTKQRISTIYTELDRIQSQAFVSPDTNEPLLTGAEQAQFDKLNAELDMLEPKLETDKQKSVELGQALKKAVGDETSAKIGKLNAQLTTAETKLISAKTKANVAGTTLKTKMSTAGTAIQSAGASLNKMGVRIGSLIKSALLFSVITKAFTALRETIGTVIMKDEQFVQSLNALKASAWTAFSPIMSAIIPALKTLVNWLNIVMVALGKFIALITGKKYTDMQKSGAGFAKQAKDAKKATSAQKGLNKEMDKTLAGFDELNVLQSTDTSSGGGDVEGAGVGSGFDIQDPTTEIDSKLQALMGIAGGALVAIGLVLLFIGHPLIGVGFLIEGAGMLGVGIPAIGQIFNEGTIEQKLLTILGIIGGALIAIGVILLLTGAGLAWGLGFIIAGATAFVVSAVNLSDTITPELQNKINTWIAIASGAMLVLGIILCVCGVVNPLSIGLIVAGAIGLAAEVALNWGAITTAVSTFLTDNQGLIVGISLALLVLGIILCLIGVITPLSIGLIVAGAAGLATEIALDWEGVKTKVTTFLEENAGLIVGVSLALLVLGIILCCTGVALPLGIGLIVAGAVGLATEVALNFNTIKEKVSTFIEENSALFVGIGLALVVLGIICLFTGVGIPLGIGLIVAGGISLATAIAPNWNAITDKIKEVWKNITTFYKQKIKPYLDNTWWGKIFKGIINKIIGIVESGLNFLTAGIRTFANGAISVINAVGELTGHDIDIPLIQPIKLPRLAKGAVLPANSPFLAVVGDQKSGVNVETPLTTMIEAFNTALDNRGGGFSGNIEIPLIIGEREFGRAVINAANLERTRTTSGRVGTKVVFG